MWYTNDIVKFGDGKQTFRGYPKERHDYSTHSLGVGIGKGNEKDNNIACPFPGFYCWYFGWQQA